MIYFLIELTLFNKARKSRTQRLASTGPLTKLYFPALKIILILFFIDEDVKSFSRTSVAEEVQKGEAAKQQLGINNSL